jgi:hypothetical protein
MKEIPMSSFGARPPYDPELQAVMSVMSEQGSLTITPAMIPILREGLVVDVVNDAVLAEAGIERIEYTIPGYGVQKSRFRCFAV